MSCAQKRRRGRLGEEIKGILLNSFAWQIDRMENNALGVCSIVTSHVRFFLLATLGISSSHVYTRRAVKWALDISLWCGQVSDTVYLK